MRSSYNGSVGGVGTDLGRTVRRKDRLCHLGLQLAIAMSYHISVLKCGIYATFRVHWVFDGPSGFSCSEERLGYGLPASTGAKSDGLDLLLAPKV